MKKLTWKLTSLGAALAMTAGGITGCGSSGNSGSSGNGKITLTFWTLQLGNKFKPYIDQVIKDFNKKYPNVTVKWVDVAGNDINTKYQADYAAGTAPDLANLDYGAFTEMAHEITPLNKYLTKDQQTAFPQSAIGPLTVNGKIMAIPFYDAGTALPVIWNMALLKKIGVTKPPTTLQEYYKDGLALHKADPNVYMGIGGAMTPKLSDGIASDGTFEYQPVYSSDYKKIVYNTPASAAEWTKMKKYWDGGVWDPDSISNVNTMQLFLQGTTASYGGGMQTQLTSSWGPLKANIDIGPPLYGPTGTFETSPAFFWVVSKESKHPKLAAQLAMTFMSTKNQLTFSKLTHGDVGPMSKDAIKDPAFFSQFTSSQTLEKKYAELQAQSMAHGVKSVSVPLPNAVKNQVGVILQTQLNDVLIKNKSVSTALQDAQKQAQAVLDKYWANPSAANNSTSGK